MRTGIAIADTTAGMFLGQGILLALLHREHTGQGQWVHTSLMEGMLNYQTLASRSEHRYQLDEDIHAATGRFTVAEVVDRLGKVGVPSGPIYNVKQAFDDPQVKHLRMTRPAPHRVMGDLQLLRSPINMSMFPHPEHFHHAAPDSGEHSTEVLHELGYDDTAIEQLKASGAVE
jgi:crotonobetainyl-CoA:carnitine CoA-transferase CaiB-like acyl-CoA transferase